tara:strand:- start:757 stop:1254 length:498 start_codon:yes stop_codon:yes gene_type:complete
MNRNQSGFTIIELIVVIALLGILSAVALPRFISLTDDAHTAAVSGAGAGFATGIALIRAQAIAEGTASGAVEGFGLGTLKVNASGAPTSVSESSNDTVNCVEVWEGLLQANAPTVAGAAPDYTPTGGGGSNAACTYTYKVSGTNARTIIYSPITRNVTVEADGEA